MKRKSYDLLFGTVAAAFLPNIFFLILFNNNRVLDELIFIHSMILVAIFSIISIGIFMLFRFITCGTEKALLALLFLWIPFWLFEAIFSFTSSISALLSRRVLLVCHAILIIILLLLLRKFNPLDKYRQDIFRVLAIVIGMFFMFNFVPALYTEIVTNVRRPSEQVYDVKVEFKVYKHLPSPDIYWLHMDGMMNFDTVHKYFGDAQEELKTELEQRGFVINDSAELIAGYTPVSTAALLSPTFYDSYLSKHLGEVASLLNSDRTVELHEIFMSDGISINRNIAPRNELYKAFMAKGYKTVIISTIGYGIQPIEYFYRFDNDDLPLLIMGDSKVPDALVGIESIVQVLTKTTSLSAIRARISSIFDSMLGRTWLQIPDYDVRIESLTMNTLGLRIEKRLYRRLLDSQKIESPRLAFVSIDITHSPFGVISVETDGVGNAPVNLNDVDKLYHVHHEYAAQVMLNTIDIILDRNPDAVLVIQGDHGIHRISTQEYMLKMGYSMPQILEMKHSVISAVRIPPQYGGLNGPVAPLNITRMLVNLFVGENYEMLSDP